MQKLGNPVRHYWLMQRMIKRTGCDAVSAFDTGELSSEEWAAMLARCRGCDDVGACRKWLDQLENQPGEVPAFCANAERFATWSDTQDEVA